MKSDEGKNLLGLKSKIFREQLITVEDLEMFKNDLLHEIKKLIQGTSGQTSKKWLRSLEVRKMLSISPGTLQNLRINGTLTCAKVGSILFYDYEDILKLLNTNSGQRRIV